MKQEDSAPLALSATQQGIYREQLLCGKDMGAYQNSAFYEMQGPLNEARYLEALRLSLVRQEQVRCCLEASDDHVFLYPAAVEKLEIQHCDLSGETDPRASALDWCRKAQQQGYSQFHHTPLSRFTLFRLGPDHHGLSLNYHQILADGWGIVEHLNDINRCYEHLARPQDIELPEAIAYREFTAYQQDYLHSEKYTRDLNALLDYYNQADALRNPFFQQQEQEHIFPVHCVESTIPIKQARQLQQKSLQCGFSLTSLLFAIFHALFSDLSKNECLQMLYVSLNRHGKRQKSIIGSFANVLALNADWDSAQPLEETALNCYRTTRKLLRHMTCPTGCVVPALRQRYHRQASFSGITINHIPIRPAALLQNIEGLFVPIPFSSMNQAVEVEFLDMNKGQDRLLRIHCRKDLFTASQAQQYLAAATALFDAFLHDATVVPRTFVQHWLASRNPPTLSFIRGAERPVPPELTVNALFGEAMQQYGDRTAIIDPGAPEQQLNYRQYEQRANLVAEYLLEQGVGRGDFVAVLLPRTLHLPVVLYGIMKTGAAYIPLDPSYPLDRLRFYMENSQAKLCIVSDETCSLCAHAAIQLLDLDNIDWSQRPTRTVNQSRAQDPLYMIYTSGSTGVPKGVCLSHRNLVHYAYVLKDYPFISQEDRVLWVAPIAFDMSVCDLYLTALQGGCLVVAPQASVFDGKALLDLIDTYSINMMNATPATYRLLLEAGWQGSNQFHLITGGEALTGELADQLLARCRTLWNLYGPTETSVCVTYHQVTHADRSSPTVSIGQPFENVRLVVVDAQLQPVALGEPGELLIGGPGVGQGYWQRDDLTAERYVHLPQFDEGLYYRTGDLVSLTHAGTLQYLGRNDRQVKIRGFRIELDEIVRHLVQMDGIADAMVAGGDYRGGGTILAAWIKLENAAQLEEQEVTTYLRRHLPSYMIPSLLRFVPRFPLTPAGKVDIHALEHLLENQQADPASSRAQSFKTPQAGILAAIWQEALGVGTVSMDDDFFALGGHSLTTFKVCNSVGDRLGIAIKPEQLMSHSRFADFAAYIERQVVEPSQAVPPGNL